MGESSSISEVYSICAKLKLTPITRVVNERRDLKDYFTFTFKLNDKEASGGSTRKQEAKEEAATHILPYLRQLTKAGVENNNPVKVNALQRDSNTGFTKCGQTLFDICKVRFPCNINETLPKQFLYTIGALNSWKVCYEEAGSKNGVYQLAFNRRCILNKMEGCIMKPPKTNHLLGEGNNIREAEIDIASMILKLYFTRSINATTLSNIENTRCEQSYKKILFDYIRKFQVENNCTGCAMPEIKFSHNRDGNLCCTCRFENYKTIGNGIMEFSAENSACKLMYNKLRDVVQESQKKVVNMEVDAIEPDRTPKDYDLFCSIIQNRGNLVEVLKEVAENSKPNRNYIREIYKGLLAELSHELGWKLSYKTIPSSSEMINERFIKKVEILRKIGSKYPIPECILNLTGQGRSNNAAETEIAKKALTYLEKYIESNNFNFAPYKRILHELIQKVYMNEGCPMFEDCTSESVIKYRCSYYAFSSTGMGKNKKECTNKASKVMINMLVDNYEKMIQNEEEMLRNKLVKEEKILDDLYDKHVTKGITIKFEETEDLTKEIEDLDKKVYKCYIVFEVKSNTIGCFKSAIGIDKSKTKAERTAKEMLMILSAPFLPL
uniref:DRBM domain-containing protein n=1 Tax=Rhabditophanes sp. KR3021 TaxID=114890 RepID=A0AC35TSN1_9BILA